jgi:hypothetical protein
MICIVPYRSIAATKGSKKRPLRLCGLFYRKDAKTAKKRLRIVKGRLVVAKTSMPQSLNAAPSRR